MGGLWEGAPGIPQTGCPQSRGPRAHPRAPQAWAQASGRYEGSPEDPAKWKTNFRCALRSTNMFTLLEDNSKNSDDPHKVFAITSGEPRPARSNWGRGGRAQGTPLNPFSFQLPPSTARMQGLGSPWRTPRRSSSHRYRGQHGRRGRSQGLHPPSPKSLGCSRTGAQHPPRAPGPVSKAPSCFPLQLELNHHDVAPQIIPRGRHRSPSSWGGTWVGLPQGRATAGSRWLAGAVIWGRRWLVKLPLPCPPRQHHCSHHTVADTGGPGHAAVGAAALQHLQRRPHTVPLAARR